MNKTYRSIWSDALGVWVAVSELVSSHARPGTGALSIASAALFASTASAQVVIPAGTDIGTYLNTGTNWSATTNSFAIGADSTWNTAINVNSAAHSILSLDGGQNTITRAGNNVITYSGSSFDNNSVTLSNFTFSQTANSSSSIFYNTGGSITSNLFLNNATFTGLATADGTVFRMEGGTGTIMNVTAGTGADGVVFSNNTSSGDGGGVITGNTGTLTFNGDYTFNNNHTDNYGGAITMRTNNGFMTFNGTTAFNDNYVNNYFAGAIDMWGYASTLTFNGVTSFTGNHVVTSSTGSGNPRGGAINIGYQSPGAGAAIVQFNNTVTFDGNYIVSTGSGGSAYGGAISAYANGASYNYQYIFTAPAIFENNYVVKAGAGSGTANGGAIYYDASGAQLTLASGTQFLNNYASGNGGAIYLQSGTISLNALTDNILFQGNRQAATFGTADTNYAPVAGSGTPNAIYLGSSGNMQFNANAGYQIRFYDPISSIAGSTVTVTKTGAGEVVFYGDNGATTSYDSAIQANTTVSGGYFTLANGVNYGVTTAGAFTVNADSGAGTAGTVRGGTGSSLRALTFTVQSGGTLAVTDGTFTVDSPTINVQDGGQFAGNGTLATTSNINIAGTTTANVNAGDTLNISGALVGTGGITVQGDGLLALSNAANSYTGATTVVAGSALMGGVANAFAASGSVAVNGTLDLSQNNLNQTANSLSGSGSILLGSATLTATNDATNTTFSGSISGTGALNKTGPGTLTLSGTSSDYSGGTTVSAGTLIATNGGATGTGTITNTSTFELDFAADSTLANTLAGSGALLKTGSGMATLTGPDSSAGTVTVSSGTLTFGQSGVFSVTDGLSTSSGATTSLGANAQLAIANALTQAAGSTLNVDVGNANAPLITATSASIDGTLNVASFAGLPPASASELTSTQYPIIHTTGGITGDFSAVSLGGVSSPVDYLKVAAQKSADSLDYSVGFSLTWQAGATLGNGTFTLPAASDAFNVDLPLANQAASATGWDGTTLTKAGAGTLMLSAVNTYTGATNVNAGTLAMGVANAIASSSAVTINSGATLALNDFSQTANNLSGTGSITLGSQASTALTANNTADTTFAGAISGSGSLTKTGASQLTLSGTNTYTGGTTISAGTLLGTTGSAFGSGAVTNDASLQLNFATDSTLANTLSGTGSLTKTGTGVATLTAAGSSQGAVSVNGGTLQLAQSGTFNASDYTTGSGATTAIGGTAQLAVSGAFAQAANSTLDVTLGSNNPLIVADTASLGGTLNVTGFTANVPSSASALTGTQFTLIHTTNGVTGEFTPIALHDASSPVDYLTAATHTSANGRDFNVGFGLTWQAGSSLGNGTFTLPTASDAFNVDLPLANEVPSATGWDGTSLTKAGPGTLTLSAQNPYTGATTINAGTLTMGTADAISASSAVTIASGATLALHDFSQTFNNLSGAGNVTLGIQSSTVLTANNAADTTFSGAISGIGSVSKTGPAALTLAAANTYAGGTTIAGGTLIGSANSFGTGPLTDNAALVIDQRTDAAFANAINGTGSFTKTGAGSLNLTGASALSGATTVASGRLAVNGSLANSAVTVANGATLGGNGTVGRTVIQSGGTIGPGNSIGTLNVNGSFAQAAGSVYQVELNPNSTSSDLIRVNGAATIAPGAALDVVKYVPGNYSAASSYTVLSATGGVTGTYALTGDIRSAFYELVDTYDANNVYLNPVRIRYFVDAAGTPNQRASAGALDSLPDDNQVKAAVAALATDNDARTAFDQLSGEIHASIKSALIEDSRYVRDIAVDRVRQSFCLPAGGANDIATSQITPSSRSRGGECAVRENGPVAWANVFGGWGHTNGDGNAARVAHTLGGFLVGADTLIADRWRVGALAGYSAGNFDVDDRNSSAGSDNYHVGLYGGTQWGPLGVRLGTAFTWHSISTTRSPAFTGFQNNLHGDYDARTTQVFGDIGYRIPMRQLSLEPFAGIAYVNLHTDGFSERDGIAALGAQSSSMNATFSTLGIRQSIDFALRNGTTVTASATLGWRHAFGAVVPVSTLALTGSNPFDVAGVPIARNAALVEAGFNAQIARNASLGLAYRGQFGSGTSSHFVQGALNIRF